MRARRVSARSLKNLLSEYNLVSLEASRILAGRGNFMESFKDFGRSSQRRRERSERGHRRSPDESTGAEAEYLKSLVDSRTEVTVLLESGERLKGRIRYYDRELFSIQLADRGLNILLQKSSVLSIREE